VKIPEAFFPLKNKKGEQERKKYRLKDKNICRYRYRLIVIILKLTSSSLLLA
jgi:hypothetical protein